MVIVAAIVAIFATTAVPKMARVLDKVQLDYEIKHLYSTLNLARSISKSSRYSSGIFKVSSIRDTHFSFHETGDDSLKKRYFYTLTLSGSSTFIVHQHNLPEKFELHRDGGGNIIHILPDSGKSIIFTLKSRFNKKAYVVGTTVGRWRGTYEKPKS